MQDVCCTKASGDAQARGRCDADCDRVSVCAKRKQARPADPIDFRRAALLSVGHDPSLADQLTDAEFKAAFALFKRAAAARRTGRSGR